MARLGPYELEMPLGRGGMGEVWAASASGVRVAVKWMRRPGDVAGLRREVRAAARLDHPGIATILDLGETADAVRIGPDAEIPAGAPWFAMELAEGGSLGRLTRPLQWNELRSLLTALLDALGHAHARGVVHRDVKLGNVLLVDSDPAHGIKLADFGVAHAHGDEMSGLTAGTPNTMAPEQILGRWRELGPWTDLYAVGALAYRQAAGRYPFADKRGEALLSAHLRTPPPRLIPRSPVPEGFATWLSILLRKDRHARFQRAADAMAGLAELGAAEGGFGAGEVDLDADTLMGEDVSTRIRVRPMPVKSVGGRSAPPAVPPFPESWRKERMAVGSARMAAVGLELFALRQGRLVGREGVRDRLWSELAAARGGAPRFVLIHGPSGIGKSALAQWLVREAHARGAALGLSAACHAPDPPGTALRRMFASHFGLEGASLEETRELLEREDVDAEAVVEMLHPPLLSMLTPKRRHRTALRVLASLARPRGVVAWLDDIADDEDAVGLIAAHLRGNAPVLLIGTAHDEALARSEGLRSVLREPGASAIPLGPLPPDQRVELIRALLPLDAALAARIEDQSRGNPGFAVQLVRDAVLRRVLVPSPHGFSLREGASLALAADVGEVARRTADRLCKGLGKDARAVLRRAALLGDEVAVHDLRAIAADLDAGAIDAVIDVGLASGVFVEIASGVLWCEGVLRAALEAEAVAIGEAPRIHGAIAERLAWRTAPGTEERRGTHLLRAGRAEEAIAPLMMAVDEREASVGIRPALSLLVLVDEAIAATGLGERHPVWAKACRRRGELLHKGPRDPAAVGWLEKACAAPVCTEEERASAYLLLAFALPDRSPRRPSLMADWERLADASSDPTIRAKLDYHRLARGLVPPAERVPGLRRILAVLETAGDQRGAATVVRNLAMEASLAGDEQRSIALHAKALAAFEGLGIRAMQAICINGLAESYRRLGLLDRAAAEYARALDLYDELGESEGVYPLGNLVIVALQRGRAAEAAERLSELIGRLQREPTPPVAEFVPVLEIGVAALLGDRDRYDLAVGADLGPEIEGSADAVAVFGIAAQAWAARGDVVRARGRARKAEL